MIISHLFLFYIKVDPLMGTLAQLQLQESILIGIGGCFTLVLWVISSKTIKAAPNGEESYETFEFKSEIRVVFEEDWDAVDTCLVWSWRVLLFLSYSSWQTHRQTNKMEVIAILSPPPGGWGGKVSHDIKSENSPSMMRLWWWIWQTSCNLEFLSHVYLFV